MIEDKDKIKDLFSSKLGNFEPEVPASVWGGLDQLLSNQPIQAPDASSSSSSANSSTANAASSTTKASIIKTIAIAVGVAAAIATGILFIPTDDKPVMEDANVVATEEVKSPEEIQDADTVIEIPKAVLPRLARARAVAEPVAPVSKAEPVQETVSEPLKKEEPEKKEEKEVPVQAQTVVMLPEVTSPSKGLSVGITANSGLFADNVSERGGGLLFSHPVRTRTLHEALVKENSEFELEHRQPISFGVTISKEIAPRLSFETGIVYTHLSSKVKSNSVFNISETQYFNYLGIPLSLNYTFFELGKTKFYFALGGMIQKDINGRYISNMGFSMLDIEDKDLAGRIFYSEPYYIKESVKQSNPQFSVRSSIGISYPLYKKMYFYGTIGGAYYFDAGNKYRTIYSDRKTQLDLNLGIKFDF